MNRLLLSACIVGMLTAPVMAQQPQQSQSACNPECNIHVTNPELDLISKGLQTQPFGEVVPLINKLRDQIIAQQPKPEVKAPVEQPKE